MSRILITAATFASLASALIVSGPAMADVIVINQAKALAGNITPGDAPGFPVTLSQPGSYRLNSNLTVGAGLDGIVIAVPDITIDFNGFILAGGRIGGTSNAQHGIVDDSDRFTVKNGTIIAFGSDGISAGFRAHLIIDNMRIINNYWGIANAYGTMTRIQNSTVSRNTLAGMICGTSCHVEGNIVSSNGSFGIKLSTGTILGNTIIGNGQLGIQMFNPTYIDLTVGFGNNTLTDNNGGAAQVSATGSSHLRPLLPNACTPAC